VLMPPSLKKRTIVRQLGKLGWRRFNGGEGWDAYYYPDQLLSFGGFDPCGVHLQIFWGERNHEFRLTARNRDHTGIHFRSYTVGLARLSDFVDLDTEVRRLGALARLDLDELVAREDGDRKEPTQWVED